MKTKDILLELVDYLDQYESVMDEEHTLSLDNFLVFIYSLRAGEQEDQAPNQLRLTEAEIAKQLSLLHRYSRRYIKKVLQDSKYLSTEEEYTYLVCLMAEDGLTKTELNIRNGLEKTSGSEVLRRLKKRGLIKEQQDEKDRRSITVWITDVGRMALREVFPKLGLAARMLGKALGERQHSTLLLLLKQMTSFHAQFVGESKDEDLDTLAEKMFD